MSTDDPLAFLRALQLAPLGRGDGYRRPATKVNSHVHLPPNFSAFASPAEATERAAAQGVRALGTSNYYDYSAYGPFAEHAQARGVFPLFGMEVICLDEGLLRALARVNDSANPGRMYLCGKGITGFAPMGLAATELMGEVRRADSERAAVLIDRLNGVFSAKGLPLALTEASVKALVADRYGAPVSTVYLQERHVALAFQEAVFDNVPGSERAWALSSVFGAEIAPAASPVEVQDAIRAHLMKRGKPAYVAETFPPFEHGYGLVLALRGVPCYPVLADGASPVCEFEQDLESLVRVLRERAIYCAELIPNRNAPEVLRRYVGALRSAGMAVLAGTEHNTLEMLPLEPRCAGALALPGDMREVFWEGACVVAAHQYQVARDEDGYVDDQGRLAGGYPDAESRLEALARLGAQVMEEYSKMTVPGSAAMSERGG